METDTYNRAIRRVAADTQVPVLDLSGIFEKHLLGLGGARVVEAEDGE
jgi:hypothetical protein